MKALAEITLTEVPQKLETLSKEGRTLLWNSILQKTKKEGVKMESHPSIGAEYLWEGSISVEEMSFRCRGYTIDSEWVMRCTVDEWGPIQFIAGSVYTFGFGLGPWCPAWALSENTGFLKGRLMRGNGPAEPCGSNY